MQKSRSPLIYRVIVGGLVATALTSCGKPKLDAAIETNDRKAVEAALAEGADPNKIGVSGDTPLLAATRAGQASSAQGLIEGGAQIDVRDNAGYLPLHHAAARGLTGIVNLLLDRGQSVDELTTDGLTSLQLAVLNAHQETARFLVRRGADLNAKQGADGVSAIEIVERNGDTRFAGMLRSAATPPPPSASEPGPAHGMPASSATGSP